MNKKYSLFLLLAIIPIIFAVSVNDKVSAEDKINSSMISVGVEESAPIQNTVTGGEQTFFAFQGFVTAHHYNAGEDGIPRTADDELIGIHKSDNIAVNNGENCGAMMLFGSAGGLETGNSVCTGAITSGFRYIGLEESATAVASTDADLNDEADETGLDTALLSSITWTNSTSTGSSSKVVAVLEATFTNSGASTETITGAGLFNATADATRGMFAHTLFSSSADVAVSDTLTVTWTINSGSGTVS